MTRNRLPVGPIVAAIAVAAVVPAHAQDPARPPSRTPAVEVGGHAVWLGLSFDDWSWRRVAPGVRVGVPLSPTFSIEADTLWVGRIGAGDAMRFAYTVQVKHAIVRAEGRRTSVFLTYGGMGLIAREERWAAPIRAPDGTIVAEPSRHVISVTPPSHITLGAGAQYTIAPYAAARVEGQIHLGFPDGLVHRIAAGVSVPIGGRYGPARRAP